MKFFLDSADVIEIRRTADLGLLDGITTNPTLLSKTGKNTETLLREIASICQGPVSCEVLATDVDGMKREAREIHSWAPNLVVKIPLTAEGIAAVRWCSNEGIKTNVTLCFTAIQALIAAKAGATYISPFVGRLDDISNDGMHLIREIKTIYDNYEFDTEILVASIRGPMHIVESALVGADIVTVPFNVISKVLQHPLTASGLAQFLADAKK